MGPRAAGWTTLIYDVAARRRSPTSSLQVPTPSPVVCDGMPSASLAVFVG
jgi:hypothetical protein